MIEAESEKTKTIQAGKDELNMKYWWKRFWKEEDGIGTVEMILILVENLALYIEYIEGGKSLKNKLYTRYTQE